MAFLFATEMWERFSYYGMRALLVLYMVKHLLQPGRAETALGYDVARGFLEWLFGPLDVQPLASQIYGFYTGLVYLTPIFGGLLADRVLGQRRTVILGAGLMAVGHFMMAFEGLFLLALLTLILGNGAFKPNISSQVGALYAPGDRRRDRAYSIFYVGINLGAFLAPLVCGTLGEELGWHYGFGAAGVGMLVGLAIYVHASPYLPEEASPRTQPRAALEPRERRAMMALVVLCVPITFCDVRAAGQHHRVVGRRFHRPDDRSRLLDGRDSHDVVPIVQSLHDFCLHAVVVALWAWQARRGRELSTVAKLALGCLGVTAANLIMAAAAWTAGGDGKASWLWLLAYFAAVTLGELYLSPIGLSLVSKVAPPSRLSMMMGIWLATSFTGNFIGGWLGGFWSGMEKGDFFLMIGGIAAAAGAAVWALGAPLKPALRD